MAYHKRYELKLATTFREEEVTAVTELLAAISMGKPVPVKTRAALVSVHGKFLKLREKARRAREDEGT